MVCLVTAQQNAPVASTVKSASATMKADPKASTINAPVTNASATKACCQGKTAAQCSHDVKTCNKKGETKAACCQKGGGAACSHGSAEKASDKKTQ